MYHFFLIFSFMIKIISPLINLETLGLDQEFLCGNVQWAGGQEIPRLEAHVQATCWLLTGLSSAACGKARLTCPSGGKTCYWCRSPGHCTQLRQ